jgi:carotenoid cleavage dioxygenase-like enzyme
MHACSFMAFHIANAWEEEDGNIVKLYLCTMNQFTMSSTDVGGPG